MKKEPVPQPFAEMIDKMQESLSVVFQKDYAKNCTDERCTFADVCKHKICAVKCELMNKPMPPECQKLNDELRAEDDDYLSDLVDANRDYEEHFIGGKWRARNHL